MFARELDTAPAYCGWLAAQDARIKSYAQSTTYSEPQKVAAEAMRMVLDIVYAHDGIHVNYRQKWITVKVSRARVRDRHALTLLEQDYDQRGYSKAVTGQGVIYRIPRG